MPHPLIKEGNNLLCILGAVEVGGVLLPCLLLLLGVVQVDYLVHRGLLQRFKVLKGQGYINESWIMDIYYLKMTFPPQHLFTKNHTFPKLRVQSVIHLSSLFQSISSHEGGRQNKLNKISGFLLRTLICSQRRTVGGPETNHVWLLKAKWGNSKIISLKLV